MGVKSSGLRHALLMGAAAFGFTIGAASVTQPAYAQEATRSYDIPAQDLDDALREFGRQTGRDVLFTPAAVAGKRSGAVQGQMTERQALETLLAGSGLRFEQTASNGYAVQDPNSPMRLGGAGGAAPSEDNGATAEILVVGRRTLNTDIRRSEDDAQPYVVFDAQEIQRSGAQSVEEFLRQRLPMNTQRTGSLQQNLDTTAAGVGRLDLRGLGTNQTLILVDGRRLASASTGGRFEQPSISGIPPSAIERIEILPTTASGAYGGGATGGVINIVLKRDYSGLDIEGTYGNAFDSDVSMGRFSIGGGFTPDQGRTRVVANYSHSQQNDLLSMDRDFGRRYFDLVARNNPADTLLRSLAFGPTPNIMSLSGNLVLDPAYGGASLNSPWTSVPEGYLGPASDNAQALFNNAGQLNVTGIPSVLSSAPTTDTLTFTIRREITPNIDAYLDLYGNRSVNTFSQPLFTSRTIAANDPSNPFQQQVRVTLPLYENGSPYVSRNETETRRANLGLIVRLPYRWSAVADAGWSEFSAEGISQTFSSVLASSAATFNGAAFRDLRTTPIANLESLLNLPFTSDFPAVSHLEDYSLRGSGPLFALPGGELTASVLLEHRSQSNDGYVSSNSSFGVPFYSWVPPATQDVDSAYVEIRAPLVSAANNLPLIDEFEFMASVRRDDYSTRWASEGLTVPGPDGPFPSATYFQSSLASTDYTVGLRYSPVPGLTFRASAGTGFLPPNLFQLASQSSTLPYDQIISILTQDPSRGGEFVTGDPASNPAGLFTLIAGGSTSLQPEDSESFSYGAIWTPEFLQGLRLSVDVTEITKSGEIGTLGLQYFLDHESDFPGRIIRGPNLPGDPIGWAGPVIGADVSSLNLLHTDVRAIDYQINYDLSTQSFGDWSFYLVATHQTDFARQVSIDAAAPSSVGALDGPLEWRGNFGLTWTAGNLSAGWNAQYFDSYSVCRFDQLAGCNTSTTAARQGSTTIPSQIYHDAFVSYRIGDDRGLLADTEIAFGIQNLFDEAPPISVAESGYSTYADPRMRRFTLTLRKHFGG